MKISLVLYSHWKLQLRQNIKPILTSDPYHVHIMTTANLKVAFQEFCIIAPDSYSNPTMGTVFA